MSSNPVRPTCDHTAMGHMFQHVLCPTQSLAKRVSLVTFGCLVLIGALFAAYSVISVIKNRFSPPARPNDSQQKLTTQTQQATVSTNSLTQKPTASENQQANNIPAGTIPEYPPGCKNAMLFAMESLKKHPNIKEGKPFSCGWYGPTGTHQPVNTQIAALTDLFWDVHFKAFKEALQKHQQNPWDQQEVLQEADALMKVAYAISCLTLEDLKPFTQQLKGKGEERTYAQALARQDSYQYRTFYMCTNVYHWIRGEIVWDGKNVEYLKNPITETFAQLFYKEGNIQHTWNQLYNDYCDRVRAYVKEEDLRSADNRHVNWTRKDTGIKTFHRTPDTRPT